MPSAVAACKRIFDDISRLLRHRIQMRQVIIELQRLFHPRSLRMVFFVFRHRTNSHVMYYHVLRSLHRRFHLRITTAPIYRNMAKSIHWPAYLPRERYFHIHNQLKSILGRLDVCRSDIRRVTQALNCTHASSEYSATLLAMAFTCIKCQAHIDSSRRAWLAVASLDNTPCEYDLNSLPVLLRTLHNRLSMAFEDGQSFLTLHHHEMITNSVLLIQRWYRLYWLRRQHDHVYDMFQSSKMKYQARKRRQQCARDMLRLQRQFRRQLQAAKAVEAKRADEASVRVLIGTPCLGHDDDNFSPVSTSICSMQSRDGKDDDNMQPRKDYFAATSSSSLPVLKAVLAPIIFRCYAPQCGGMRFQNKKWYELHLEKHAHAKARLEREHAFLSQLKHELPSCPKLLPKPNLVNLVCPAPPVQLKRQVLKGENHPRMELPPIGHQNTRALLQLVRVDEKSTPQLIRVTGSTVVLGRSQRHCDCIIESRHYRALLSKQHARLRLTTTGEVELEDLSSTNGTFVNGMELMSPQILHIGDIVEFGRVKYRPESGIVYICQTPTDSRHISKEMRVFMI